MATPSLSECGSAFTPDDLNRAFDTWWAPEYAELKIEGRLANALPSWDVFGIPVNLAVTDPEARPYCVANSDKELQAVLTNEWDHEPVLAGLLEQARFAARAMLFGDNRRMDIDREHDAGLRTSPSVDPMRSSRQTPDAPSWTMPEGRLALCASGGSPCLPMRRL